VERVSARSTKWFANRLPTCVRHFGLCSQANGESLDEKLSMRGCPLTSPAHDQLQGLDLPPLRRFIRRNTSTFETLSRVLMQGASFSTDRSRYPYDAFYRAIHCAVTAGRADSGGSPIVGRWTSWIRASSGESAAFPFVLRNKSCRGPCIVHDRLLLDDTASPTLSPAFCMVLYALFDVGLRWTP
jgi:hypothetical protein